MVTGHTRGEWEDAGWLEPTDVWLIATTAIAGSLVTLIIGSMALPWPTCVALLASAWLVGLWGRQVRLAGLALETVALIATITLIAGALVQAILLGSPGGYTLTRPVDARAAWVTDAVALLVTAGLGLLVRLGKQEVNRGSAEW